MSAPLLTKRTGFLFCIQGLHSDMLLGRQEQGNTEAYMSYTSTPMTTWAKTYRKINCVTSLTSHKRKFNYNLTIHGQLKRVNKTPSPLSLPLSAAFKHDAETWLLLPKCSMTVCIKGSRVCEYVWEGNREEKLDDGGGRGSVNVCLWGREECVVMGSGLFPSLVDLVLPLCLQLKAHADFVSAGVEVLPIDQGWESDLHTYEEGRDEEHRWSTIICSIIIRWANKTHESVYFIYIFMNQTNLKHHEGKSRVMTNQG